MKQNDVIEIYAADVATGRLIFIKTRLRKPGETHNQEIVWTCFDPEPK